MILARCQQIPQVSVLPEFTPIFSGDSIKLSCDNAAAGSRVRWYLNNTEFQGQERQTWSIPAAAPTDSGSYSCESNGQRSRGRSISVLDYVPPASLSLKTGQPVMRRGDAFTLFLENDDGLDGWNCWVYMEEMVRKIGLRNKQGNSHFFQAPYLNDSRAIYWCSDRANQSRSSPVTIRTSDKEVLLEMIPGPAMAGESLTLRCLVWGTNQISQVIFYKNDQVIQRGSRASYEINKVSDFNEGRYKCQATYTYKDTTGGTPYQETSDAQELFVQAPPLRAVLSADSGMSCSCSGCPSGASYRWYFRKSDQQSWEIMSSNEDKASSTAPGSYACRAVWTNKRTLLSNVHIIESSGNMIITIIISVIVVGVLLCLVGLYLYCRKRRGDSEAIYQDVPLTAVQAKSGDDGGYEELQNKGREREYDNLKASTSGEDKKGGDYQPLQKGEVKDAVYHTLGQAGEPGADGGYTPLTKKQSGTEYETLEAKGEERQEAVAQ